MDATIEQSEEETEKGESVLPSKPGEGVDSKSVESLMARRASPQEPPAGISQGFWDLEEEDVESAPRDMKLKWKKLLQKRSEPQLEPASTGEDGESKWPDLPMELLLRIMALVDYRTVVVGSGVCNAWRDSLRQGISDLSFSWCGRNVSKLVQSLAPKFTRLSSCNLRRHRTLNDSAIEAVGHSMHELKSLDLTVAAGITDLSLAALAGGCPRLEKLYLSGCSGITEDGLVALAEGCTKLRQLNLCGCDNAASDRALKALGENCSGLQSLNVGWCTGVTDVGVTALACGCSELRVVDLCECHYITDRSVMVLADHCLRLRVLNLYMCRNLTDLSMYALASKGNLYRGGTGRGGRRGAIYGGGRISSNRSSAAHSSSKSRGCSRSSSSSSSSSSSYDSINHQKSPPRPYIETLVMSDLEGYGLVSLNLSGCRGLSASAVQEVCNAYPGLHTCREKCSLELSGCLNLTSVHCRCKRWRPDERGRAVGSPLPI